MYQPPGGAAEPEGKYWKEADFKGGGTSARRNQSDASKLVPGFTQPCLPAVLMLHWTGFAPQWRLNSLFRGPGKDFWERVCSAASGQSPGSVCGGFLHRRPRSPSAGAQRRPDDDNTSRNVSTDPRGVRRVEEGEKEEEEDEEEEEEERQEASSHKTVES
ncbi:hypothetical protein EYF80_038640 [Liparis tanakae]|uniref:Uncharacterized protein n=1 Tax=Liparis tanakae TaxID=230148 RepID=A0A4Z2GD35_9TELE|nr:hypothetical protein EYF80_038640 [Liparis tanakae]